MTSSLATSAPRFIAKPHLDVERGEITGKEGEMKSKKDKASKN